MIKLSGDKKWGWGEARSEKWYEIDQIIEAAKDLKDIERELTPQFNGQIFYALFMRGIDDHEEVTETNIIVFNNSSKYHEAKSLLRDSDYEVIEYYLTGYGYDCMSIKESDSREYVDVEPRSFSPYWREKFALLDMLSKGNMSLWINPNVIAVV